mmetsp:Transcript_54285/g.58849  ORF Transcript_54285/g.58849 Transcript_54285/m.58849 type:complete len:192 (-) Transcript_54285:1437-2012(-)
MQSTFIYLIYTLSILFSNFIVYCIHLRPLQVPLNILQEHQSRLMKKEKSRKKDKEDKGRSCARRCKTEEPELIDVKGNRLFRRKLIAHEFLQDSEEGRIIKVTFKLCKDENELQFPDTDAYGPSYIDVGLGDYFRIAPTEEWWNYTGVSDGPRYSGVGNVLGTRAYSPVGPMQNQHSGIDHQIRHEEIRRE